jgi:hypothetical protein
MKDYLADAILEPPKTVHRESHHRSLGTRNALSHVFCLRFTGWTGFGCDADFSFLISGLVRVADNAVPAGPSVSGHLLSKMRLSELA